MEVRAAMAPQDNLEGMSFPRLKALAAARGVDVSDLREKAELVALLLEDGWRPPQEDSDDETDDEERTRLC